MIKSVFNTLKEYERVENKSHILDKGHINNMPLTKVELKIKRFLK